MATTTPNFGWPVPTSTDLVKDGATAIEALGDSIDASLLDLKGGTTGQVLSKNSNTDMDFTWVTDAAGDITGVTAGTGISGGGTSGTVTVTNSMATAIDAKGDLIGGTGADAFARLPVGTNGQILTADSTAATGLAWATATSGGMTLLASGSLSGSQTAITSLSGSYKTLVCYVISPTNSNEENFGVRLNNDSGSNYGYTGTSSARTTTTQSTSSTSVLCDFPVLVASGATQGYQVTIQNYTAGNYKTISITGAGVNGGTKYAINNLGMWANTAAVTEIDLFPAVGTFSGGTYQVYGVK
jgi:hypothetical protein